MRCLWLDLCYAVRMFRAHPGISSIAILSLALGIGANSTIFSFVDGIYLRPLPVRDPGGLVWVNNHTAEGRQLGTSWLDYLDLKSAGLFADVAAQSRRGAMLDNRGEPELVLLTVVSDNYFSLLGVQAARGLLFGEASATEPAVAISDSLWRRRFGADPALVGRTIRLNNRAFTVTAVLPAHFRGLVRAVRNDVWVPASTWRAMGNRRELEERGPGSFEPVTRLRPGTTLAEAQTQLDVISRRFEHDYPNTNRGWRLLASTARMGDSGTALRLSVLLLSIAGLVVLIACTNVALLLLAQAEGRRHEIAIRLALGADRGRLARQLLTESAPLVLASTGAALLMAHWTIPLLPALLPPGPDFVRFDVRLDGRVVLVTLAACALANVLFGLAPWLQASRTDLNSLLKGAVWETRRRFFGRGVLVAMQAALAVVLITSAGLLARSFLVSQSQPLGFDSGKKMLMLVVGLISPRGQMAAACGQITERIRSLPGVRHAAYCRRMMLSGFSGEGSTSDVLFPGRTEVVRIRYNQVSPDYFETAGTRLLAGRAFTRADTAGSTPVALVSRTMARQFWPGQDPVGRWVRVNNIETRIVGVVEDAIIADIHEAPEPFLYVPLVQMPTGEVTFLVETSGEPPGLMDAVKREIRAVQPAAPVFMTTSMKQHVREALYGDWLPAVLSAVIGVLGIILAAAGLFGVMLHTVNRSLRELGVRMALGATAANLLASVLRRACVLAGSGAVLGVALSFPAGRLISGMLYGVSPYDPAIATLSVVIVLTVALAAGFYPAWKAARVDPAAVLRQQ